VSSSSGLSIEASIHDCRRDNKEECDDTDYAVAPYKDVIFRDASKSVAHSCTLSSAGVALCSLCLDWAISGEELRGLHTIISHRSKVESHEIGEQEVIASRVPSPIANVHGV
jgi:hypothetical protein